MRKKHVSVYLNDKEMKFVQKKASMENITVSEWMRNIIVKMTFEDNRRRHNENVIADSERKTFHNDV